VPTISTHGGYRFFFYSNEGDEPPHIHVQEGNRVAKFWLTPVRVANYGGFAKHKINELKRIVTRDRNEFLREWNEFFDVTT
jgi:hypothetical protein